MTFLSAGNKGKKNKKVYSVTRSRLKLNVEMEI